MSGIRIDALDSTVLPSRDHEFPAMRDGITVKMRVAQILALMEAGDLPFDLDELLAKSGGTMSGDLDMDGNALLGVDWEKSDAPYEMVGTVSQSGGVNRAGFAGGSNS